MLDSYILKNLRHNFTVNVLDGAFFGLGLGLASYVTVIPLFVNSLTDSTILIGLIATAHVVGWQLPQLLTSGRVTRLPLFRPMVLWMTLHERIPFLLLAGLALLIPLLHRDLALVAAFILVCWQSFGGGFTATAWQSMLGKILPPNRRGIFYGTQSAAANLFASGGSVLAGLLLVALPYPSNFAACFFLAGVSLAVSFVFLASTREPVQEVPEEAHTLRGRFWSRIWEILRADGNFRWFMFARMLSQLAQMAVAFYTIYAVREYGMTAEAIGILTGILMLAQTFASPLIGWFGDRWGHRMMFAAGNVAMAASAIVAITAPNGTWLSLAFILAGVANAVQWTTILAMVMDFGTEKERPYYIGLTNTLVAPVTLAAPVLGGWVADAFDFHATFAIAAAGGLSAAVVLVVFLRHPKRKRTPALVPTTTPD